MAVFEGPEEFMAYMQDLQERQNMKAEADYMALENFLEDVDGDQLMALHRLIRMMAQLPELTHYYVGVTDMMLRYKHDKCSSCGNKWHSISDHDVSDYEPPST